MSFARASARLSQYVNAVRALPPDVLTQHVEGITAVSPERIGRFTTAITAIGPTGIDSQTLGSILAEIGAGNAIATKALSEVEILGMLHNQVAFVGQNASGVNFGVRDLRADVGVLQSTLASVLTHARSVSTHTPNTWFYAAGINGTLNVASGHLATSHGWYDRINGNLSAIYVQLRGIYNKPGASMDSATAAPADLSGFRALVAPEPARIAPAEARGAFGGGSSEGAREILEELRTQTSAMKLTERERAEQDKRLEERVEALEGVLRDIARQLSLGDTNSYYRAGR